MIITIQALASMAGLFSFAIVALAATSAFTKKQTTHKGLITAGAVAGGLLLVTVATLIVVVILWAVTR